MIFNLKKFSFRCPDGYSGMRCENNENSNVPFRPPVSESSSGDASGTIVLVIALVLIALIFVVAGIAYVLMKRRRP
jgi:hypothetical protein